MKPTSSFIVASSAVLLSACSALGSSGSSGGDSVSQTSEPVHWKEVTRMVAGTFVTYRVPVNQKVNSVTDEHDLSAFDAGKPQKTAQASTVPASGTAGSAKSQPKFPMGGIQAPVFREAPPAPSSSNISQDAEVALGQAEIVVRDAQSRFETAQTALNRARDAARSGDSGAVIKFSKTAQALAHPAP